MTEDDRICTNCFNQLKDAEEAIPEAKYEDKLERLSRWWLVLPIFLGLIGGIIAFVAFRKEDYPLAKQLLFVGLAVQVIIIVLYGLYILGTYMMIAESTSDLYYNQMIAENSVLYCDGSTSTDYIQGDYSVECNGIEEWLPNWMKRDCEEIKEFLTGTDYEDCLRLAKSGTASMFRP